MKEGVIKERVKADTVRKGRKKTKKKKEKKESKLNRTEDSQFAFYNH